MCTVCGCGKPDKSHGRTHDHGQADMNFGNGLAGVHVPGMDPARIVQIEQDILGANDQLAAKNREKLKMRRTLALNLVSSPGSGKTTLLVRSIIDLKDRFPIAVIEGDQQTAVDTDRIRETGVDALQINTGKGCHLDAHMVGHAFEKLDPKPGGVLFIENVGNLVCPAAFDLGEAHKVVVLSVTEGDDKPLKYPDMFHAADVMILNKTDLLPHVSFDVERCEGYARRINPRIQILHLSATTGEGLDGWYDWIDGAMRMENGND